MARPPRLERGTLCLEGRCSIQLSYGRKRTGTPKQKCNPGESVSRNSGGSKRNLHPPTGWKAEMIGLSACNRELRGGAHKAPAPIKLVNAETTERKGYRFGSDAIGPNPVYSPSRFNWQKSCSGAVVLQQRRGDIPHAGGGQGMPRLVMLVYGEQGYRERLSLFVRHLRERSRRTDADSLDETRTLLIQTGQLEQGVEDLESEKPRQNRNLSRQTRQATDAAVKVFLSNWAKQSTGDLAATALEGSISLAEYQEALDRIEVADDPSLRIRIPEGFEHYTLFPEQYCETTLDWLTCHKHNVNRRATVLGLRSIGTTLSGVVAAVLRSADWEVERLTVRPTGDPFHRVIRPDEVPKGNGVCSIVVDEGPGLSGSSIVAAAGALSEAGYSDISIFPGHSGNPGTCASAEVWRWWGRFPRYCIPLGSLHWNGLTLAESLSHEGVRLISEPGWSCSKSDLRPSRNVVHVEDLSAGLWRSRAYSSESEWPAVATRFERNKYLCGFGSQQPIFWKFTGLGCCWPGGKTSTELELERLSVRQAQGLIAPPVGSLRGFLALPWIEGTRAVRHGTNRNRELTHLFRYVAASAGPALVREQFEAGRFRLRAMVHCNVSDKFGPAAAEQAAARVDEAQWDHQMPCYTDGHLAPEEWVVSREGALLKTDYLGQVFDHTLVGEQPLLWDLASAIVEWELIDAERGVLLETVATRGIQIDPAALSGYELAYAAFRMGLFSFCADQTANDDPEQSRLRGAEAFYQSKLENALTSGPGKTSGSPVELARPNR